MNTARRTIRQSHTRGYTLVELIVSVAIFSIVMLIAGAAFLALINLDRQARTTNDLATNLSYVIDSMERSIRTGTAYSAVSGGSSFSFTDAQNRNVSYQLSNGQIQQRGVADLNTWIGLTDPRVTVTHLSFYSRGTVASDSTQPMVLFTVRGTLKPDAASAPIQFVIGSGATQRLIDI